MANEYLDKTGLQIYHSKVKQELTGVKSCLEDKVNKNEVTNSLIPKGNINYANLPTINNSIGDYYYCIDGDGVNPSGNYVWNGVNWYFGGTGDEGYSKLSQKIADGSGIDNGVITVAKLKDVYSKQKFTSDIKTTSFLNTDKRDYKDYCLSSNSKIFASTGNILAIPNKVETKVNGVTFSVSDGVIAINGTSSPNGGKPFTLPLGLMNFTNNNVIGKYATLNCIIDGVFDSTYGYIGTPFNVGYRLTLSSTSLVSSKIVSLERAFEVLIYPNKTFNNVQIKVQVMISDNKLYNIEYTKGNATLLNNKVVKLRDYDVVYTTDGAFFDIKELLDNQNETYKKNMISNFNMLSEPYSLLKKRGVDYDIFSYMPWYIEPSTNAQISDIIIDNISTIKFWMKDDYTQTARVFKKFNPIDMSNNTDIMFTIYIEPSVFYLKSFNMLDIELSDQADATKVLDSCVKATIYTHNLHVGWNHIKIVPSKLPVVAGNPNLKTIQSMRLRMYCFNQKYTCLYFKKTITIGQRLKPTVLINFDDSAQTLYENGFPYMKEKGLKGTMFLCNRSVRDKWDGVNVPLCMDFRGHIDLENNGWEIAMHSKSHNDVTDLETTKDFKLQYDDLRYNYDYIVNTHLMNKPISFSTPNGKYNDYTIEALRTLKIKIIRSCASSVNYGFDKYNGVYIVSTKEIRKDTTLEQIKAFVDEAITYGGVISIFTHQINVGNTNEFSMEFDLFKQYIDYVCEKKQAGEIEVITFNELYNCIMATDF